MIENMKKKNKLPYPVACTMFPFFPFPFLLEGEERVGKERDWGEMVQEEK